MDTTAVPSPDAVVTGTSAQRADADATRAAQAQAANSDTGDAQSVPTVSASTRRLIDIFA